MWKKKKKTPTIFLFLSLHSSGGKEAFLETITCLLVPSRPVPPPPPNLRGEDFAPESKEEAFKNK